MHQQKVLAFHEKHDFWTDAKLYEAQHETKTELLEYVQRSLELYLPLLKYAQETHTVCGDHKAALVTGRVLLLVEELSEVVSALTDGSETELLDGLADLAYVTYGTAVAFDLPLDKAIDIVHLSNMTKEVGKFKPSKGVHFVDPKEELSELIKNRRENSNIQQLELPFP